MAINQPIATDKLNAPDHSLSHRVFANDDAAPVQRVTVINANGDIAVGNYVGGNYCLINGATGVMTFVGTAGLDRAYACFSDSTTQTITGATTSAYAMTFNTDVVKNRVTHSTSVNPSRITFDRAGVYQLEVCPIVHTASNSKTVDIWFAINGTNVPASNTSVNIGAAGDRLFTIPFQFSVTAGQYLQVFWSSDSNGTTLEATGTQINPTRPSTPSVILTVNKIST